jgi:plastocyanin
MLQRSWKAACVVIALGVVGGLCASLSHAAPRKPVKPKVRPKDTASVVIHIQNHTYLPASGPILPGSTVQWINDDNDGPHTASSDDGAPFFFDTGDIQSGGGVSKIITMPNTPMAIPYHCNYHPDHMRSTLNVGNSAAVKKKPKKR